MTAFTESYILNWPALLSRWIEMHSEEEKNLVEYLVIGGGLNDSYPSTNRLLLSNMAEFVDIAKHNFTNLKTIYCAYFGWAKDGSEVHSIGCTGFERFQSQDTYFQNAKTLGMTYLPGCRLVMHDKSLLVSDGIHPNEAGNDLIATAMSEAILHGCYSLQKEEKTITTVDDDIASVYSLHASLQISQKVQNDSAITKLTNLWFGAQEKQIIFSGTHPLALAQIKLPYTNQIPPTKVEVLFSTTAIEPALVDYPNTGILYAKDGKYEMEEVEGYEQPVWKATLYLYLPWNFGDPSLPFDSIKIKDINIIYDIYDD